MSTQFKNLYEVTGDIKDINTMLVPRESLEAVEKDAARYRWLRDTQDHDCRESGDAMENIGVIERIMVIEDAGYSVSLSPHELDAAVDKAMESPEAAKPLYYLQDSRSYVGNDVLWWAKGGNGYTTDLRKAAVYAEDEAQVMHDGRHSDIPWPKAYIDQHARPAVDMQYIKRDQALAGTPIEIYPLKEGGRKEALRCQSCGAFMSTASMWAGECRKCGADNRP